MAATRVVNVRQEPCDVYIGRPMPGRPGSPFGNPFRIGEHGNRDQVIDQYREWLLSQPALLAELESLRGKRLGCWCHPARCHGDVLVELVNGAAPQASAGAQADLFGDVEAVHAKPRKLR